MPGLAERIGDALGVPVTGFRPAGRAHGYRHARGTLADGRAFFAKAADRAGGPVAAAFAAEANGLRWLAAADGGPPVPRVLTVTAAFLVTELAGPPAAPSAEAAGRFGAALARMHAAGAASFGAPWPGFIASLPLDNAPVGNAPVGNAPVGAPAGTDWGSWYAQRRLVPYLRRARDDGLLSAAEAVPVEAVIGRIGELAGPPGPPSRIHGDLWSGNLLWAPDRAGAGNGWLIDPAAHGGHRETDLAMLALFGAPELAAILRGYTETAPLADGWRARVPLHQLHPLLVHMCLFGRGYAAQLTSAANAALAS